MSATDSSSRLREQLASAAGRAGCVAWGVTPAEPWPELAELLRERAAAGLAADMAFTYRNPNRSTDATRLLRGATSLFVVAWPYPVPPAGERPDPSGPRIFGRVAAYATRDHATELRDALAGLRDVVRAAGGRAAITADGNGLVDREAAVRAGVGVYGRNCNVLVPGVGSWALLGSIVTDRYLEPTVPTATTESVCGHCRRCLVACPTGALISPGVLDAGRCLAWVVQAPGRIAESLRVEVGDRVYGCDDCQTCCPESVPVGEAEPGPVSGTFSGSSVDVLALWDLDDAQLLRRVDHWYVAARDVRHLRRTLLVVLGNAADPDDVSVRRLLREVAVADDALLADHARWALARLTGRRRAGQSAAGHAADAATERTVRLSHSRRGRL